MGLTLSAPITLGPESPPPSKMGPLGIVLLLAGLMAASLADDPQAPQVTAKEACDAAWLFFPDSASIPGNGNWGTQYFAPGPCLGVSGIGMTQTHMKTVLVIDRTDFLNSYLEMPGTGGQIAWAQEVNLDAQGFPQRALNVQTNTFCSSGQHAQDGKFFSIGGDQAQGLSNYIAANGGASMRLFEPCTDGSCDFKIDGELTTHRWYPTSQLLGDGRIVIVGGSNVGVAINSDVQNIPSLEYYPDSNKDGAVDLPFLADTLPYNLYPFVHLLPNGRLFIFAGDSYVLFDTGKNEVAGGNFPKIGAKDGDGNAIVHSYPLAGSSVMFTLSPQNQHDPEIMVCGGSATPAFASTKQMDEFAPASNGCWRISPLAGDPNWAGETMKSARVMPLCVLLPDGRVLVHGGAAQGHSGIPNAAHKAVLSPELYDTNTHTWYDGDTGTSSIPRVYHGSAVLLHDATVFISGSNPHQNGIKIDGWDYPTEFRTEFYYPPYFRLGLEAPAIIEAPVEIPVGTDFDVSFHAHADAKSVSIVLSQPGFSTHGANHGMRQVELEIKKLRPNGRLYAPQVAAPPDFNIAPPSFYWLFVVVDGMPSRDGHYVFIK